MKFIYIKRNIIDIAYICKIQVLYAWAFPRSSYYLHISKKLNYDPSDIKMFEHSMLDLMFRTLI